MSETMGGVVEAPPVEAQGTAVTDSKGRTLMVRELSALELFDLYEIAGEQSSSPGWMNMAMAAAAIRTIDQAPQPFPQRSRDGHPARFLRSSIARAGMEGISAALKVLSPAPAEEGIQTSDATIAAAGN